MDEPLKGLRLLLSAISTTSSCLAVILQGRRTLRPYSPTVNVVPAVEPPVASGSRPFCALRYLVRRGWYSLQLAALVEKGDDEPLLVLAVLVLGAAARRAVATSPAEAAGLLLLSERRASQGASEGMLSPCVRLLDGREISRRDRHPYLCARRRPFRQQQLSERQRTMSGY